MKLERLKLENSRRSWKVRGEVGKLEAKLESTTEVGKWLMKLESLNWTWKYSMNLERSIEVGKINRTWKVKFKRVSHLQRNFPTSKEIFQLRWVLSNFAVFFPTSLSSFTSTRNFPTSHSFQLPFPTVGIPWLSLKMFHIRAKTDV